VTGWDWLRLATLILGPLLVGTAAAVLIDAALNLRELSRLARAHPGGIPLDAVPWHLRPHVRQVPNPPADRLRSRA
jgi:hypothetical protein